MVLICLATPQTEWPEQQLRSLFPASSLAAGPRAISYAINHADGDLCVRFCTAFCCLICMQIRSGRRCYNCQTWQSLVDCSTRRQRGGLHAALGSGPSRTAARPGTVDRPVAISRGRFRSVRRKTFRSTAMVVEVDKLFGKACVHRSP